MKKVLVVLVFAISLYSSDLDIKSSVVKIFTVSSKPSIRQPWTSIISGATGSGCIIDGNKILTNAHVVTHSTYLQVQKNGDTSVQKRTPPLVSLQSKQEISPIHTQTQKTP